MANKALTSPLTLNVIGKPLTSIAAIDEKVNEMIRRYDEVYNRLRADLVDGPVYGEINFQDNSDALTLNSAAKVQITNFDTNGLTRLMGADHTNNHIIVRKAGVYLITVSIHVNNNAAQSHDVNVDLWKNNGTTEFGNVHAHRTLTGGSGDVGSMSLSGIIQGEVNDTLELWANTNAAANRSVTFQDVTLSVVQIRG